MNRIVLASICCIGVLAACSSSPATNTADSVVPSSDVPTTASQAADIERLQVVIHERLPYDASAFTQGLEMHQGDLLIGTGMEGESKLLRTTLDGEVLQQKDMPAHYFGEGITVVGDTIWQLTWKNGVATRYAADSFEELDKVAYEGEGWGLCAFDAALVMSDGSDTLQLRDPETFELLDTRAVRAGEASVPKLNELECVHEDGREVVYANLFTTTDIVRIDLDSGNVTAVIDASAVPNNAKPDPNHVLNGIAAIPEQPGRFYIGGKRWPDLYEVSFEQR